MKHSYEVSSIPFEIFAEIRGNKDGDQVQNVSQYIYRWLRRYDGTIESLREKSRRPRHHPNQHTEQELKLIRNMRRLTGYLLRLLSLIFSPRCNISLTNLHDKVIDLFLQFFSYSSAEKKKTSRILLRFASAEIYLSLSLQ